MMMAYIQSGFSIEYVDSALISDDVFPLLFVMAGIKAMTDNRSAAIMSMTTQLLVVKFVM